MPVKRRDIKSPEFTALTAEEDIAAAVTDWRTKFSEGALPKEQGGGTYYWQPNLKYWGFFGEKVGIRNRRAPNSYWLPYGISQNKFRQNILVELNPPGEGVSRHVQGLLALDQDGDRWILHKGRLHPRDKRVNEDEFDIASGLTRKLVRAGTEPREYHVVANIDASIDEFKAQILDYVLVCREVRQYYTLGPAIADENRKLAQAEQASSPERPTAYWLSARGEVYVDKQHPLMWEALALAVERLGLKHSREYIEGYGPDLRTIERPYCLFELKSSAMSGDIQQAVGQLLLYEKILKKRYTKIIVVPDEISVGLLRPVSELGIQILLCKKRSAGNYYVDHEELRKSIL